MHGDVSETEDEPVDWKGKAYFDYVCGVLQLIQSSIGS